jgi:hypothetical protein
MSRFANATLTATLTLILILLPLQSLVASFALGFKEFSAGGLAPLTGTKPLLPFTPFSFALTVTNTSSTSRHVKDIDFSVRTISTGDILSPIVTQLSRYQGETSLYGPDGPELVFMNARYSLASPLPAAQLPTMSPGQTAAIAVFTLIQVDPSFTQMFPLASDPLRVSGFQFNATSNSFDAFEFDSFDGSSSATALFTTAAIPEPSAISSAVGLAGWGFWKRRRRDRRSAG